MHAMKSSDEADGPSHKNSAVQLARLILPLLFALLILSPGLAPPVLAQAGGAVFALPGRMEPAEAPFDGLLIEEDGTRTGLVGSTATIDADIRYLAARRVPVLVWGMRQPRQGANPALLRVSRIEELPTGASTPLPALLPTTTSTPDAMPSGELPATDVARPTAAPTAGPTVYATAGPTAYPTLVSLPSIGQPVANITAYAANVRAGPGPDYVPLAAVKQGTRCLVLGIGQAPGWYYLQCPVATGWVRSGLYALEGPLDALPVLVPLTPTPDPLAAPPVSLWQVSGFANRDLAGDPAVIFGADTVDFDSGLGSPDEALPVDEFSLRLEGTLPFASGVYSIALTYDDGARLYINNELVIDDWNEGAARSQAWQGALGGDVPLRIEFFEAYSDALLQLVVTPLQSQAAPPTPVPNLVVPLPPVGEGWLATYYGNPTPGGLPALTQLEPLDGAFPLNREFSVESPAPGVLAEDNWSARWRGRFDFAPGDYRFTARGNDGVRVYIDGVRMINAWPNAGDEVGNLVRDISAGEHEVVVEMYDAGGPAWVRTAWELETPAP